MGSSLAIKRETIQPGENQQWLKFREGTTANFTGTLNGEAFLALWPDGIVPSGIGLALVDDLYEPYADNDGTNEVDNLVVADASTGGTYTVKVDGETATINATDNQAAIQAALDALSNVNPEDPDSGHITVGAGVHAGSATTYPLTFGGKWGGEDRPAIAVVDSTTGSGHSVTGTTATGGVARVTCEGLLFTTTNITTDGNNVVVPIFWGPGGVRTSKLPTHHGIDAAAQSDLNHLRFFS